jgi:hypothetical protein
VPAWGVVSVVVSGSLLMQLEEAGSRFQIWFGDARSAAGDLARVRVLRRVATWLDSK